MKTKGYLVITRSGSIKAVKTFKGSIDPDSIAIAINIEIPDSAFKPLIHATIKIDESDVKPLLIDTGKLEETSEMIKNQIGFDVVLKSISSDKMLDKVGDE